MPKLRVLVVDDAVVMRKIITETLSRDPDIEVVGVAANGSIALQKLTQVNPDAVTLDVEMPDMDGITMLKALRKTHPLLPVIMFSTLTARGGQATLEALSCGANDYVTKPSNVGNVGECIERLQTELVTKLKAICRRPEPKIPVRPVVPVTTGQVAGGLEHRRRLPHPVELICVGTSTGGPNALADVFKKFPADCPVPIVIVQHMPPLFTALLAERLTATCPMKFHEGAEGQVVLPGHAYIAPGGRHMEVCRFGREFRVHLHDGPAENSCRPAVDVLFRSVVACCGGNVLGVVMTGMGQDGMRGCELIREKGGQVVVQDHATSVVWGMPGAVAEAGFADKIVPLGQIADEMVQRVRGVRALAA